MSEWEAKSYEWADEYGGTARIGARRKRIFVGTGIGYDEAEAVATPIQARKAGLALLHCAAAGGDEESRRVLTAAGLGPRAAFARDWRAAIARIQEQPDSDCKPAEMAGWDEAFMDSFVRDFGAPCTVTSCGDDRIHHAWAFGVRVCSYDDVRGAVSSLRDAVRASLPEWRAVIAHVDGQADNDCDDAKSVVEEPILSPSRENIGGSENDSPADDYTLQVAADDMSTAFGVRYVVRDNAVFLATATDAKRTPWLEISERRSGAWYVVPAAGEWIQASDLRSAVRAAVRGKAIWGDTQLKAGLPCKPGKPTDIDTDEAVRRLREHTGDERWRSNHAGHIVGDALIDRGWIEVRGGHCAARWNGQTIHKGSLARCVDALIAHLPAREDGAAEEPDEAAVVPSGRTLTREVTVDTDVYRIHARPLDAQRYEWSYISFPGWKDSEYGSDRRFERAMFAAEDALLAAEREATITFAPRAEDGEWVIGEVVDTDTTLRAEIAELRDEINAATEAHAADTERHRSALQAVWLALQADAQGSRSARDGAINTLRAILGDNDA